MAKTRANVGQPKKQPALKAAASRASALSSASTSAPLAKLAHEYRAFKKANPAKAARVPESIKQQARQLRDTKVTYSAIAEACGIALGSVRAWIEGPASRSAVPGRRPGRPAAADSLKQGWVTIRIEGRELEVQTADFWNLLRGGFESSH